MMYEIYKSAIKLLDEGRVEDPYELIHDIADSLTPVYTWELLELAQNNHELATTEPENFGAHTAIDIITANVYEKIYDRLCEYMEGE